MTPTEAYYHLQQVLEQVRRGHVMWVLGHVMWVQQVLEQVRGMLYGCRAGRGHVMWRLGG